MQHKLVDEKRWIGQKRFLHALNFCMLLPGPEAQQLAIYTGWLLNGIRGGLIAGSLFVLPGMLALLALFTHNHLFWIAALLLALVQFPDFSSPLASMARSLEKLAGRAPPEEALVSSPTAERAPEEEAATPRTAPLPTSETRPAVPEKVA